MSKIFSNFMDFTQIVYFSKSLTFTKLIPGKTYHFAVYTVYKGVKSRPVIADITTCKK